MTLCLDHIFVATAIGASVAQALLDAGFLEGSGNTHPGQGTSNRRFFFEHGFLELLWVQDELEATSAMTGPTRLWERWYLRDTLANPFGICFSSPAMADPPLPFSTWAYEPRYLSKGKRIYFAKEGALSEPELFALSWPQAPSAAASQPKAHRLPFLAMDSVSVGLPKPGNLSPPMRAARDAGLLSVHPSATPELVLSFTSSSACPYICLRWESRCWAGLNQDAMVKPWVELTAPPTPP